MLLLDYLTVALFSSHTHCCTPSLFSHLHVLYVSKTSLSENAWEMPCQQTFTYIQQGFPNWVLRQQLIRQSVFLDSFCIGQYM